MIINRLSLVKHVIDCWDIGDNSWWVSVAEWQSDRFMADSQLRHVYCRCWYWSIYADCEWPLFKHQVFDQKTVLSRWLDIVIYRYLLDIYLLVPGVYRFWQLRLEGALRLAVIHHGGWERQPWVGLEPPRLKLLLPHFGKGPWYSQWSPATPSNNTIADWEYVVIGMPMTVRCAGGRCLGHRLPTVQTWVEWFMFEGFAYTHNHWWVIPIYAWISTSNCDNTLLSSLLTGNH